MTVLLFGGSKSRTGRDVLSAALFLRFVRMCRVRRAARGSFPHDRHTAKYVVLAVEHSEISTVMEHTSSHSADSGRDKEHLTFIIS